MPWKPKYCLNVIDNLAITATYKTPAINFNPDMGLFEIKGVSTPNNPFEFYNPIVNWLDNYSGNPNDLTTVNIYITYFDTSSSKWILHILKIFEKINGEKKVIMNWYYEEDDEIMMESGEVYQSILNMPMYLIEK